MGPAGEDGLEGPAGPTGPMGPAGPVATTNYLRAYGSLALAGRVYNANEPIVYDNLGDMGGNAIQFTPTGADITLEGGRVYLAIFEAAIATQADAQGTSITMQLDGASVTGSGIAFWAPVASTGSNSITSAAIFTTGAGAPKVFRVVLGDSDPVRVVGPIINIVALA